MTPKDKNLRLLRALSYASAMFSLLIALVMVFGFLQLKFIKPLENPVLSELKKQYDGNPEKAGLKEQIRAIDLMARRAFFSARWQVETGSYLLLFGAIVFFLSQRMLHGQKKNLPAYPTDFSIRRKKSEVRKYLVTGSAIVVVSAIVVSFLMRNDLPDPLPVPGEGLTEAVGKASVAPSQRATLATPVKTAKEDETYPFFRGIGSRGIVSSGDYPTKWDGKTGTNISWKREILFPGNSSPIIWGDRLFFTGANTSETKLFCLDRRTGTTLWSVPGSGIPGEPSKAPDVSPETGLAAPTAATNGEVVVAIFGTGNLIAHDMEGKRMWAKNIGVPDNHYGHASSLVIHNHKVLVQYDQFDSKSLIAFNINNGMKVWETKRNVAPSWSSPVLAEFNGMTQVILSAEPIIASYNPDKGTELWSIKGIKGEIGPSVGINSKYVFMSGEFTNLLAIAPGKNPSILWKDKDYVLDVASPLATDQLVFAATSYGAVACFAADSGEKLWEHEFDQGFYSSPILVGDRVYLIDKAGVTRIFKADRAFILINESPLGERVVTTPAFSDGKIYIRGMKNLYCVSQSGLAKK